MNIFNTKKRITSRSEKIYKIENMTLLEIHDTIENLFERKIFLKCVDRKLKAIEFVFVDMYNLDYYDLREKEGFHITFRGLEKLLNK